MQTDPLFSDLKGKVESNMAVKEDMEKRTNILQVQGLINRKEVLMITNSNTFCLSCIIIL